MTALDQSITEVGRTMCLLIPSSFGERPSASPTSCGRCSTGRRSSRPTTLEATGCWRSRFRWHSGQGTTRQSASASIASPRCRPACGVGVQALLALGLGALAGRADVHHQLAVRPLGQRERPGVQRVRELLVVLGDHAGPAAGGAVELDQLDVEQRRDLRHRSVKLGGEPAAHATWPVDLHEPSLSVLVSDVSGTDVSAGGSRCVAAASSGSSS